MGICSTCPRCGAETWNYCCPSCDSYELNSLRTRVTELERTLDTSRSTTDALVEERNGLVEELQLTREEVVVQTQAKEQLLREVERLQSGQFTDAEFQALCHNFPPDRVCIFRKGCTGYQVQLFGQEAVQADMARELRWAIKQVAYRDGSNHLAELIAELLVPEPPEPSDQLHGAIS